MVYVGKQIAESLPVRRHSSDGNTAEARPVVSALAADQPASCRFAAAAVIGERNLKRRVDRLGAGIRKERIVEIRGHHPLDPLRNLKRPGMTHLKSGRVIEFRCLPLYRFGD